ncbi:Hypothetical predicted protein, partial [Paramuricea clavata]
SLLHVVAGCKTYLNEGRFTWRHDSVLNFIASILKSVNHCNLYADLPGYISPSVITGDELRPDLLITLENKCIYILELTVGFESNLLTNRKRQKYQDLINEQLKNYEKVKFVNLSISSLGVFSHPSLDFTEMLKDLKFDEHVENFVALGRHSWRCKQRINQAERDPLDATTRQVPVMQSPNAPVSSRTVVKCCCGKICGLKMHQRSCQVIHGLNDELCADLEEQITTDNSENISENEHNGNDINTVNYDSFPELKKGINLPKNDSE